ncbi:neuropeptide CCHamide-2 receptor-like [Littorina saxatilis]|uniref:neuropeptide CCHamide-2 receptor-like n=1 Tax=Littorina saxatilis TaxID=31220 RepID=UPI0038B5E71A
MAVPSCMSVFFWSSLLFASIANNAAKPEIVSTTSPTDNATNPEIVSSTSTADNATNPEIVSTTNTKPEIVSTPGTVENATKPEIVSTTRPTDNASDKRGTISMRTVREVATVVPVLSIVVAVTGIALNVPSLLVFHRMPVSVSNSYMKILLLLDIVCLVISLPVFVVEFVHDNITFIPLIGHYVVMYLSFIILMGSRHAIFVITSLMNVDRCVTLVYSMSKVSRNPLHHPKIVSTVVTVLVFTLTIPGLTFRFDGGLSSEGNANTTYDQFIQHFRTEVNPQLLFINNVLFRIVPFPLILASNIWLFAFLVRHSRQMVAAGIEGEGQQGGSTRRRRLHMMRSVKLVLVYSFVFLLFALPAPCYTVVEQAFPALLVSEPNLPGVLKVVTPFLVALSSSADFFVYFAVSHTFRVGFKALREKPCCVC